MKPNEKQIKFIDECINILKSLKNTSDLGKQEHTTMIQDALEKTALECDSEGHIVTDNETNEVSESMENLLFSLRKLS